MVEKAKHHYKMLRLSSDTDSTIGAFYRLTPDTPPRLLAFTLEDEKREVKVPGETRIPGNTIYEIKLQTAGKMAPRYAAKYPWHKHGMLCLQNVKNFTGIFIHPGTNDDHTDGCILIGDWVRQNTSAAGQLRDDDVVAYRRLYSELANTLADGVKVTLEVEDYA